MSKNTNIFSTIFHRNIFSRVPHKRIILVLELVIQISFQTCTIINKGFNKICCLEWKGREKRRKEYERIESSVGDINEFRTDTFGCQIGGVVSRYFAMLRNAKSRRRTSQSRCLRRPLSGRFKMSKHRDPGPRNWRTDTVHGLEFALRCVFVHYTRSSFFLYIL